MGVSGIPLTDFVIFTNVTFPVLVLKVTSSSRWEDEIKPSLRNIFHNKTVYVFRTVEQQIVSGKIKVDFEKMSEKGAIIL